MEFVFWGTSVRGKIVAICCELASLRIAAALCTHKHAISRYEDPDLEKPPAPNCRRDMQHEDIMSKDAVLCFQGPWHSKIQAYSTA